MSVDAPFTREVIKGSLNSLSAPSPQTVGSTTYAFSGMVRWRRAYATVTAGAAGSVHGHLYGHRKFDDARSYRGRRNPIEQGDQELWERCRRSRSGSGTLRSYLRFNVPALAWNGHRRAKLRLFVTDASTAGGSAYTVGNNWTETGITWNNAPPITGNALAHGRIGCRSGTWVEFDVTSAIASAYASELCTERREHECGGLLESHGHAGTAAGDHDVPVAGLAPQRGDGGARAGWAGPLAHGIARSAGGPLTRASRATLTAFLCGQSCEAGVPVPRGREGG